MANTNFLQFDIQQTNMLSDANYYNDTERSSGFVTGISRSILFNKTLFQTSTMATAIANVLVNRGYNAMDNNLSSLETAIDSAFSMNRGLPIGSLFPTTSPITVAPEGFLLPNGSAFDPLEYTDLASVYRVGTDTYKYGQVYVDGRWWPRTPDLRGYFLRVHNPRPVRVDIDNGPDAGRTLGTSQTSQNLEHDHSGAYTTVSGSHIHPITQAHSDSGFGYPGVGNPSPTNKIYTDAAGDHQHSVIIPRDGGDEARPYNYALTYLIVAKNEVNLSGQSLVPGTGIDIINNVISAKSMVGATSSSDGSAGMVPAPLISDRDKFLKGDGTWGEVSSSQPTYNSSTNTLEF